MYNDLKAIANAEGILMNQFVTLAIVEKIATLNTLDYLEERANRGSRENLLAILNKALDIALADDDRL